MAVVRGLQATEDWPSEGSSAFTQVQCGLFLLHDSMCDLPCAPALPLPVSNTYSRSSLIQTRDLQTVSCNKHEKFLTVILKQSKGNTKLHIKYLRFSIKKVKKHKYKMSVLWVFCFYSFLLCLFFPHIYMFFHTHIFYVYISYI